MKRLFCFLGVMFLVLSILPAETHAGVYRIKWAAQTPRIAMFTYVATLARYVNKDLQGQIKISPMETGGLRDNLERVGIGLSQIGLTNNLCAYAKYKGIDDWKGKPPCPDIRALWGGYVGPIMNIAIANRGIKTMYDLAGKKTGWIPGTCGGVVIKMYWDTLGIKPNLQLMGTSATIDAMKAGTIDAYYRIGPLDASVLEIEAVQKLEFLATTKEDLAKFDKAHPGYAIPYVLPAKTYRDQPEDVLYLAYSCGDYAHKDIPEDVIYKIVKSAYAHRHEIADSIPVTKHGNWADMFGQTLKFVLLPLHKGAVKAYTELGYKVPDNLIPPEAK
jgi:TRAP transporter TAXI family solute receptor